MSRDKDVTKGKAWVGRWNSGQIGWRVPTYVTNCRGAEKNFHQPVFVPEDEMYLCEVTVKVIKDKRGRYIKRTGRYFSK